jgi:hypothetical protein
VHLPPVSIPILLYLIGHSERGIDMLKVMHRKVAAQATWGEDDVGLRIRKFAAYLEVMKAFRTE